MKTLFFLAGFLSLFLGHSSAFCRDLLKKAKEADVQQRPSPNRFVGPKTPSL